MIVYLLIEMSDNWECAISFQTNLHCQLLQSHHSKIEPQIQRGHERKSPFS